MHIHTHKYPCMCIHLTYLAILHILLLCTPVVLNEQINALIMVILYGFLFAHLSIITDHEVLYLLRATDD